ncbi:hypothetical protein [Pseudoalteromonas phenolica]|uniref:hypothetical protein n=1 Tax=Pseudoalteromonas phenolica TaxID=161398 RepID=UPI00110B6649|nr:hypothetical protein [Pseudoalteromonas phenolica]TMO55881.1 hypothetical protein CWC21_08085 [Pseudoalteromonas phenolica]
MENWPIFLVSLLVHLVMFSSAAYSVLSCQIRTASEKSNLVLLALFLPILGPAIVHHILKRFVKHKGQWLDMSGASNFETSGSIDNSASSDSGGDSGSGGD